VKALLVTVALLFGAIPARASDFGVWAVPATEKLTAMAPGKLSQFQAFPFTLTGRRGSWVDFQVVVGAGSSPLQIKDVRANFDPSSGGPAPLVYLENFVFVRRPSGNKNLAKLWWPDALIPWELESSPTLASSHALVLWVSAQIPDGTSPSSIAVIVTTDAGEKSVSANLNIDRKLQPPSTFRANVAVYYDNLRAWYAQNAHLTFADADWTAEKRRYYDFLLDYGFNAYDLPVPWGSPESASYLQNPRVLSVRVPPIDSPEFSAALSQLRATGTLNKAYCYRIDEPSPQDYPAILAMTAKLRPLGIRHLVTVHPNEPLKGEVDIWCPNVGDWFGIGHVDFAALARERAAGRETWCYTMVQPKYPYPTWLLDDSGNAILQWGLDMYRDGYTGCVYSQAHGWGPDPLHDLTSFANTSGDGTLLYPAELVGGHGLMPSIRLMLLREALQQYEVLRQEDAPRPSAAQFAAADAGKKAIRPLQSQVDGSWTTIVTDFQRFPDPADAAPTNPTAATITVHGDFLDVHVNALAMQEGEWVAVDIAPEDLLAQPEWLRFKVTERGELSVNRRTRAGDFEEQVPGFTSKIDVEADHWTATLHIPFRHLGYPLPLRVDVDRRTEDPDTGAAELLSAWPYAGDPFRTPVLEWGP